MTRTWVAGWAAAALWVATVSIQAAGQTPQGATTPGVSARQTASSADSYRAVLDRYCVTCHNTRTRTAGLALDGLDLTAVGQHSETWEKVVRKLRARMMPPAGMPRPEPTVYDQFAGFLEQSLDRAAASQQNPGVARLHRLNRAEYGNSIRDLLALEIDPAALLPPDDSSFGFDNIADVLGVSPSLQERYLSAARVISALAVGDPAIEAVADTYTAKGDFTQTTHIDGLPLGTRGGMLIRRYFPLDGEYTIQAKIFRTNEGNIRGTQFPHRFVITVDGEQVFEDTVGGPRDNPPRGRGAGANAGVNSTTIGDAIDARWQTRVKVKAGMRAIGVTFVVKNQAQSPDVLKPFLSTFDHIETLGVPQIEHVKIAGPFNPTGAGDTPSRARIFTCRPTAAPQEAACARTILSALARRAYRRPITADDMTPIMTFYESGRKGGTFDSGIQMALRFILASPEFAFRAERDPAAIRAGAAYRVNDVELASRLSYFLWSSIPDEELLTIAAQGRLRTPRVLAAQMQRMIADPKAKALTDNFAGQWLYLRNLRGHSPILDIFPDFDDNLRQSMRRETELLFESVIHENRPVIDLLDADYTFVNERLARHYGMPNVYGSQFRRVAITDPARRGLLGQGSILTVTSRANRTSVVLRGKWILENILGSAPPPPPPDVPALAENEGRRQPKTLREQMEDHRRNPTCASCHRMMDPLGFALENFDAVGAWRKHDAGNPIDAAAQLADGTQVNGVVELRRMLLARPQTFVQTLTEKLLTYALGRGLEPGDMPAVRAIVRDAAGENYRFSAIVRGIVTSTPFQMRIKPAESAEPAAGTVARH